MNKPISSKEALLKEAKTILLSQGEKGLSLRTLARKAGISLGAVYTYFSSKEEIVGALMEDFWKEIFYKGLCEDDTSWLSSELILTKVNGLLEENYETFSSLFSLSKETSIPKKMFSSPYIIHFVHQLALVLKKEDPEGRVFSGTLSYENYAKFLFMSLLEGLLQGKEANDVLLSLHKQLMKGTKK
jgi:AcrR family transcriptional regulator